MDSTTARAVRPGLLFFLFLVTVLSVYAVHLFSFTLFEGYTTLSSDSFGYILLAKKWSPWFMPSAAEAITWPGHQYPPVFPWLLAVTGASGSTYAGHLLVSLSLLLSIVLLGWLVFREMGPAYGMLAVLLFCLLPGVVYSSLGILSENLFLACSLAVLLVHSSIAGSERPHWGWYLALLLLISLALLTRTIGIALVGALSVTALFDRRLSPDKRIALLLVAGGCIVIWQVWGFLDPQNKELQYLTFMAPSLGSSDMGILQRLLRVFDNVIINVFALTAAWNRYLTIGDGHAYYFVFSYLLLVVCLVCTALRAARLKLDAVYVLFYLGILLIWPYPEEMPRFLHPIAVLLLLQPLLIYGMSAKPRGRIHVRAIAFCVVLLTGVTFLHVQGRLVEWQNLAREKYPLVAHSREYYSIGDREEALKKSQIFNEVMHLMASTSSVVPEDSTVASVQYAALTLLADRKAVNLSVIVPFHQQLCNYRLADVDFVFISALTGSYNPLGMRLLSRYEDLAAQVWSLKNEEGIAAAHLIELDRPRIDSLLDESDFDCREFRDRPMPKVL